MAITTQLVGKLGGGLSWTKVTGTQKSIKWDATDLVVTSATLDMGKTYLLAMKYTYVSGNPTNCNFSLSERAAGQTYTNWVMSGPTGITAGTRQYPFMVAMPFTSSGVAEIRLGAGYQSGTHVVSADLYYAELPTL